MSKTSPYAKKKVLVVDDDLGILEAFKFMLESSDYEVMTVSRGDEVTEALSVFHPHVILLDLYLSGFDGRDIAEQIKSNDKTKAIPIVMISAHPSAGQTLKGTAIDDFLPKPFDVSDLLKTIEKHTAA